MRIKPLLATAFAAALTLTSWAPGALTKQALADTSTTNQAQHEHVSGPFDRSIANEERLIKMLKKEGIIKKNASKKEEQASLRST